MVLAFVAIVVVSGGPARVALRPSRTALVLAFGAGAAIALQLVCLDQAPDDSGVAPLLVGRAVSSAVVLGAALFCERPSATPGPAWRPRRAPARSTPWPTSRSCSPSATATSPSSR